MKGWTTTSVKARAGRATQHKVGEMNKLEAFKLGIWEGGIAQK